MTSWNPAGAALARGVAGGAAAVVSRRADVRLSRLLPLLVMLPLIYGSFQYTVDVYPLYALSKVLPVLLAPLVLVAFLRHRLPARGWFVALALYAGVVTPFISAINFGGGLLAAATTQVKLLPVSYYFSFFLLLWYWRPSYRELLYAICILGALTIVLFPVLWAVIPEYRYHLPDTLTKLFIYDEERGYRITLPLFFLEIFLFYQNRKFWTRFRPTRLAWVILAFAMLYFFNKERASMAGLFAVTIWAALSGQSLTRKLVLFAAAAAAAILGDGVISYFSSLPESASVSVRQDTIAITFQVLNTHPIGWLIGLGSAGHFSAEDFQELYLHNFYLADIGLIGNIYEYGIAGVTILLVILIKIVAYFRRELAFTQDPLLLAFYDQLIYQILVSPILPITFVPAEWAATFALFVYFRRRIAEGRALARGP